VPPRLSGNKRSSEEPTIKPLKKVIKLTVNPPQPVPTLKRKTTIEDKSSKKQKLTEDSFQRSERV
jgi:hypothetical protein